MQIIEKIRRHLPKRPSAARLNALSDRPSCWMVLTISISLTPISLTHVSFEVRTDLSGIWPLLVSADPRVKFTWKLRSRTIFIAIALRLHGSTMAVKGRQPRMQFDESVVSRRKSILYDDGSKASHGRKRWSTQPRSDAWSFQWVISENSLSPWRILVQLVPNRQYGHLRRKQSASLEETFFHPSNAPRFSNYHLNYDNYLLVRGNWSDLWSKSHVITNTHLLNPRLQ